MGNSAVSGGDCAIVIMHASTVALLKLYIGQCNYNYINGIPSACECRVQHYSTSTDMTSKKVVNGEII